MSRRLLAPARRLLLCLAQAALLAVASGCSEEPRPPDDLASARQYLAQEDYAAAHIAVKNVLLENPDDAEGRWLLGGIHLHGSNPGGAVKELNRALELGWPAEQVIPALAEALLALDDQSALALLDASSLSPTAAARVLSLQAEGRFRHGDYEAARALVERAREREPDSTDARLVHAQLLSLQGEYTAATLAAGGILKSDRENADAWRVIGLNLLRQERLPEALIAFDRAIEHSGLAVIARLYRALIHLQLEDVDAAREDGAELLRVAPEHAASLFVQGLLDYHDGRYGEAVRHLTRAYPLASQFPVLVYYLASSHRQQGAVDEAFTRAREFHAAQPWDVRGRELLAALELDRGHSVNAIELLRPVLDFDPDKVIALRLLADAYLHDGEAERALGLYMRAERVQGNDVAPARFEASSEGKSVQRIAELLHRREHEAALQLARDYQLARPTQVEPALVLARVYIAAKKTAQARKVLERLLLHEPRTGPALRILAGMELSAGRPASARKYYDRALEQDPKDLYTLLQLALMEFQSGNTEGASAFLDKALRTNPGALEPRLGLALLKLRAGQPGSVPPLLEPLDPLQRRAPRVRAIEAAAQLATTAEPSPSLTLLLQTVPTDERFFLLLSRGALETGQEDLVRDVLQRILADSPGHPGAMLGRLVLAEAEGDDAVIDRYLEPLLARARAPEAPEMLELRAYAASRRGDPGEAVALARRAFEAAPGPATLLKLAGYQLRAGQSTEAEAALAGWLERNPADSEARLLLAEIREADGDGAGATAQYRELLRHAPDHVVALNNLAWLLRHEQPVQALELIRRAQQLQPQQPAILDSLAVIEHLNGNQDRALFSIEAALRMQPGDPDMELHRAMIWVALGRTDEAVTALESLSERQFPQRDAARRLLDSLRG